MGFAAHRRCSHSRRANPLGPPKRVALHDDAQLSRFEAARWRSSAILFERRKPGSRSNGAAEPLDQVLSAVHGSQMIAGILEADCGGFSAAARRLGLTPAAVSRNVAMLERNLGVRLFQRSTRSLTLTEDGERFLASVTDGLEAVQLAIADVTTHAGRPAGVLKVSMALTFSLDYVLPLLPAFMQRYPDEVPDFSFENRQVDLIAEGFDAAIGGGMELASGVVARQLAPLHVVAVASPEYLRGHKLPRHPNDLAPLDGIAMRSARSGRVRVARTSGPAGCQACA